MKKDQIHFELIRRERSLARSNSALTLINLSLEHSGASARTAALIILSLEADAWFKFSPVELVHLDDNYRKDANNVLIGVMSSDFKPSGWLERVDIDVSKEIEILMKKWCHLKTSKNRDTY